MLSGPVYLGIYCIFSYVSLTILANYNCCSWLWKSETSSNGRVGCATSCEYTNVLPNSFCKFLGSFTDNSHFVIAFMQKKKHTPKSELEQNGETVIDLATYFVFLSSFPCLETWVCKVHICSAIQAFLSCSLHHLLIGFLRQSLQRRCIVTITLSLKDEILHFFLYFLHWYILHNPCYLILCIFCSLHRILFLVLGKLFYNTLYYVSK